jgi:hypothetical protein
VKQGESVGTDKLQRQIRAINRAIRRCDQTVWDLLAVIADETEDASMCHQRAREAQACRRAIRALESKKDSMLKAWLLDRMAEKWEDDLCQSDD